MTMETTQEARDNMDASHGFSAKVYPLGKDMINEDMLLTLNLKVQHEEASFYFLINRGSTQGYECLNMKEDSQKFELDSDLHLSIHDMDAILLCGADVRQAGDIIRFLLNYPHLQVVCTEAVAISLKLYLYDAIFLKQTESCLIVSSQEETTQEDQEKDDQGMGHLDQDTCYFTVQEIDKALSQLKRVRFYEILTFVKKIPQGQGQNAQTFSLAVQAVPSGISLGSCAWYFCGEGEYASVLVSDHLTPKSTWLFDGFEPTCLKGAPSMFISTCRFNPKLDSPSDSTTPWCLDVPQLPQDVGSKIINFTKRILSHGGSVVIPVDINFDALRLLSLFQSSWTVFWKTYPIYFISPTADLLVSFARAMLCWVSRKIRTDFSETRHNPLAHFPSIRFVSYAQECLLDSSVPRVLICTPFHLSSGSLFSLDAWLSVCEHPNSAILFLKPPSPKDMLYLKRKTSLNVKRFVPYSSMMPSPLFHDPTKQPIHLHSSQSSGPRVDRVKKSQLTASFSTESLHQDIVEVQPDDYGLPLTIEEEDDWADLRLPTCQHPGDGSCSLPTNSDDHDAESFSFHTSSHVDEAHFRSHFNSSAQSRVSLWETMLKTLQRAKKDMTGNTPRTSKLDIQAFQHTILGFYNEPAHLDIQTTEHFMEWLLPIILIEPSHVIILPRIVTPRVLSFLFSTCLQNTFPKVPSLYICAPQKKKSLGQNGSLINLPDTPTEHQWCGFCQVSIVWNELFIDLQDPYVAEFLKQHQTMLHGCKDHEILKDSQSNSCLSLTYHDTKRSQSWGIHHNDPIMSLAYIPLKIHPTTIPSAHVAYAPNSSVANQNTSGDKNMTTGNTKNNLEEDKGTAALTHLSAIGSPTRIPSHPTSGGTHMITHPRWVHIGHVTQSAMVDLLRNEFSKEWISISPRCILLKDSLTIHFSHQDNGHQIIHLGGGWDMGTLRTKQRLMSVLRGIGSFLSN